MNWLAINITYLTARFLKKHPRSFGITEIIRTSDFVECTFARESKNEKTPHFLLFSAHLFIPLTSSKVLALGKAK